MDDAVYRLARVIVEALELATMKAEQALAIDLFAAFGLDLAVERTQVDASIRFTGTAALYDGLARRLATAAGGPDPLVHELTRWSGELLRMLTEVYDRLARSTATTAGTSETFRLQRDSVGESLTISPAFIEQVRQTLRSVVEVDTGEIDVSRVLELVRWDSGELYGVWPFESSDRLLDGLLHLRWLVPALGGAADRSVRSLAGVAAALEEAAEVLAGAAERLVRAYMAQLDATADAEPGEAAERLFALDEWRRRPEPWGLQAERERFARTRRLGATAAPVFVSNLDQTSEVGLVDGDADRLSEVVAPATGFSDGTAMSGLAGWVALWRTRRWAQRSRQDLEERLLGDPLATAQWLESMSEGVAGATAWLRDDALTVTGVVDAERLLDSVRELLNLPLWRQRSLLYEVWVLCSTLAVAEEAGWSVEVCGLTAQDRTWVLAAAPSPTPVAALIRRESPHLALDVWREPVRMIGGQRLTPDLAITTPAGRDLVVVEAKDRYQMDSGYRATRASRGSRRRTVRAHDGSALGIGCWYARVLNPLVTWVVNHNEFDQTFEPATNHGDPWSPVHLASRFRPGEVPEHFATTVAAALTPLLGWPTDVAMRTTVQRP